MDAGLRHYSMFSSPAVSFHLTEKNYCIFWLVLSGRRAIKRKVKKQFKHLWEAVSAFHHVSDRPGAAALSVLGRKKS